ncbi:hypothetical protein NC651_021959 [Populus alba x Populus x berolinensis]|nr:hypothetical protein NC651_021959 [Populus alba x Populus x berolinensis]
MVTLFCLQALALHLLLVTFHLMELPEANGYRATLSIVFKPKHNSFTGNHEIIVLIAALQEKDKSTVAWHDRRNAASIIDLDGADALDHLDSDLSKSGLFEDTEESFEEFSSFYALALKDPGLNEIAHFGNEALTVAGLTLLLTELFWSGVYDGATWTPRAVNPLIGTCKNRVRFPAI